VSLGAGLRRDDWPLRDPKGQPIEEVRAIRDEIRDRVQSLIGQQGLDVTADTSMQPVLNPGRGDE
jgi:hypothetical protein